MTSELFLGIDIGTSSSKGVVVTHDGTVVAATQRNHGLSMPAPGWAEHDPSAVWWAEFCSISRELAAQAPERISGVGISGIGPCLLPAGSDGEPLRPAILYGIDTRASAEIAELTERYGDQAILQRAGSALTSQAVGPKLLWLRHHEPEVWSRTSRLFMCSSYLAFRLTGEYMLDHHSASQADPLYDLDRQQWSADWWNDLAPPAMEPPPLAWSSDIIGAVTSAGAHETGLLKGTPVVAGTIDAWSEALSVGATSPGDLMLMYGSTFFLVGMTSTPVRDARLWSTRGCFAGTSSLAAGLATSGSITSWLQEVAGGVPFAQLIGEASIVAAGSEGLVVLPYFAGERTPLHDPNARGLICGLTLRHGRGHLYRAVLEGTAYAVRHNLDVIEEVAPAERIVAVGGGTAGELWLQIVSDVTGRAQEVPRVTVGASYGDAFLAAVGVGAANRDASWNEPVRTVEPDLDASAAYEPMFALFRALYPATRDHMHALAAMQRGSAI